jgi:hypothetical protein
MNLYDITSATSSYPKCMKSAVNTKKTHILYIQTSVEWWLKEQPFHAHASRTWMSRRHTELCSVQNGMGSLDKTTASPVLAKTHNGIQTIKLCKWFASTSYSVSHFTRTFKKTKRQTETKHMSLKRKIQKVLWHRSTVQHVFCLWLYTHQSKIHFLPNNPLHVTTNFPNSIWYCLLNFPYLLAVGE